MSQLTATIESLAELYTTKSTAKLAKQHTEDDKVNPLTSNHLEWDKVRAFFQYWYGRDGKKEPYSVAIIRIGQALVNDKCFTFATLRDPSRLIHMFGVETTPGH